MWEDRDANFARLAPMIAEAAGDGARLVVLTEMYSTGFSMDTERIAEPVDGPSAQFLRRAGRASTASGCAGRCPRCSRGDELPVEHARARRARRRDAPLRARSTRSPTAGSTSTTPPATRTSPSTSRASAVSFFVCYDLRFADEFWALAPDTDCYVVVANWPAPRRDHWRALLTARAIENQAYVVGVNRVGHGGKLDYAGDSAVVQPFGETHEADGPTEQTLSPTSTPVVVAETRARYPFLTDRR